MQDTSSSRSSMTMIECEDATLLSLSQEIDAHTSQLRNNVLQSIASIRSKMHAQTAEAMEHQHTISQATEQRLIQQIENLQSLLELRTTELVREKALTDRLIGMQCVQKRRQRQRAAALEALRAWHRTVSREKELTRIADKAVKERQEREARTAFVAWRLQSMKNKYDKALEKTINESRRAAAKATHEHQSAENAAKLEILALKEKVASEEERRAVLEEKLKAAFMRGVCALNLEAMQVLRNTTDAGTLDASVASLVQQLNLSGLSQNGGAQGGCVDGSAEDAATLARLLQRQQALTYQMDSLQSAPRSTPPPAPIPAASAKSIPPHQAFTVAVNPSYSKRVVQPGVAGAPSRTATRTTVSASASTRNTVRK